MTIKTATMFMNVHKTTVRVKQMPILRERGASSRIYLIYSEQNRLLFKLLAQRFADGSFKVDCIEVIGSTILTHDEIGYIGTYQSHAEAFEAGMYKTFERLVRTDGRLCVKEHVAHIERLLGNSRTQTQFEVILGIQGYIDAKTKDNPQRRNLDQEIDRQGTYYEITSKATPVKFSLLVSVNDPSVTLL